MRTWKRAQSLGMSGRNNVEERTEIPWMAGQFGNRRIYENSRTKLVTHSAARSMPSQTKEKEAMPRKEIDLPYRVDYLSILDQNGQLDKALEPDISDDLLLSLYHAMVLGRRFDERMLILQRQGRIGTFAPIKGQEASHVGAVAALQPEDWLVPSFRETAAELYRGKAMESVLLVYGGYNEGGAIPEDVNNLPVSVPVGTQTLHAAGLGYALKYRKQNRVAMCFFGDGATSEGDFHEAMNFAAVFQTPVIFVCQNNHWAISIPRSKQTRSQTLAQKAIAYGMPGIQVDGNDILAVYTAAKEAVDLARSGGGPTFIECLTYRLSVHTTADDPKRYRKDSEVEEWLKRDPIIRFQQYLRDKGVFDDEKLKATDAQIDEEIKTAEKRWEERMRSTVEPLDMFEFAYAEMPPNLIAQREELRQHLSGSKGDTEEQAVVRE
jgi:pyruvate dehydrogenase E1 component alpha subunit